MMTEIIYYKELFIVIGAVTAILATIGGFFLWVLKMSFQKGKLYQLFETLVEKVSSIEELIDDKFIDNDSKHQEHKDVLVEHHTRITTLEVINDVKRKEAG
jgi:hypothetical protein